MKLRKILFWGHLIGGVSAGLIIFLKAVTGIMLAYEPQIVEYFERSVRVVTPAAGAQRMDINDLAAKAQEYIPAGKISGVTVQSDPTASVLFNFGREYGALYLNPYTGEKLGGNSKIHDFLHEAEDLHRGRFWGAFGHHSSGIATIIFFLLACSGLYLWWPTKTIQFRKGLRGKARDWNWHNVFGFWTVPIAVVVALTGVIITYKWATNILYYATGNEPPPAQMSSQYPAGEPEKLVEAPPMASLKDLLAPAEVKVPGYASIGLRLPPKPGGSVTATILETEYKSGIPARSTLTLDAATAAEKKWEPFSEINSGRRARIWARYLHTGEAGGLLGRFIALLASVGAVILVWTGFALSWRRYRHFSSSRNV